MAPDLGTPYRPLFSELSSHLTTPDLPGQDTPFASFPISTNMSLVFTTVPSGGWGDGSVVKGVHSLPEDPRSVSKWLTIAPHFAPVAGTAPRTYVLLSVHSLTA